MGSPKSSCTIFPLTTAWKAALLAQCMDGTPVRVEPLGRECERRALDVDLGTGPRPLPAGTWVGPPLDPGSLTITRQRVESSGSPGSRRGRAARPRLTPDGLSAFAGS